MCGRSIAERLGQQCFGGDPTYGRQRNIVDRGAAARGKPVDQLMHDNVSFRVHVGPGDAVGAEEECAGGNRKARKVPESFENSGLTRDRKAAATGLQR